MTGMESDLHPALLQGAEPAGRCCVVASSVRIPGSAAEYGAGKREIASVKNGDRIAVHFTAGGVGVSFDHELRGKMSSGACRCALLKVWLAEVW